MYIDDLLFKKRALLGILLKEEIGKSFIQIFLMKNIVNTIYRHTSIYIYFYNHSFSTNNYSFGKSFIE